MTVNRKVVPAASSAVPPADGQVVLLAVAFAVNRIRAISCAEKIRLTGTVRTLNELAKLSLGDLEYIIGRRTRIRNWEPGVWIEGAERDEKGLTAGDFHCTFYLDGDYPPLLREIHDPPYLLFYRGLLPRQDHTHKQKSGGIKAGQGQPCSPRRGGK